jgi:uroporphyrinogen-III synthase
MPRPLDGVRVAITENRYPEQLTTLLERLGATVISCPLLKETPVANATGARRFISICELTPIDYIVFYTGVGVDFLFRAVNKPEVVARSKILARGPKAVNALRRAGLQPDFIADEPTTEGILKTLSREPLAGKTVLVQLYGNENPQLFTALQKLGATGIGVSIYSYTQASDTAAIEDLVRKVIHKQIDAITFTSATQVPFLFQTADAMPDAAKFRTRLKKDIVVVSVGAVTSRALLEMGVEPRVEPAEHKMGAMVRALGEYFRLHPTSR